jgi:hypothetical protein
MIQPLTLIDHDTGKIVKRHVDCVPTSRNDYYQKEGQPKLPHSSSTL